MIPLWEEHRTHIGVPRLVLEEGELRFESQAGGTHAGVAHLIPWSTSLFWPQPLGGLC